ncbi:MAG TPA: hypothetical protein VMH00_06690 [Candidatus Limnocylindrales bacterium]|nr:hypothetical protein [Candidatus Limnocylindrales bacterium]
MPLQTEPANCYRVEVSGWDSTESFFVEKTMLNWTRDEQKHVNLRSVLREGSVVFVRLLQPVSTTHNFPIAYQAKRIGPRNPDGFALVHLSQLRPRPTYRQNLEDMARSARVA